MQKRIKELEREKSKLTNELDERDEEDEENGFKIATPEYAYNNLKVARVWGVGFYSDIDRFLLLSARNCLSNNIDT